MDGKDRIPHPDQILRSGPDPAKTPQLRGARHRPLCHRRGEVPLLLDDGLDRIRMNPPRFHHGATEADRLCGRIKDSMILDFTTGAGALQVDAMEPTSVQALRLMRSIHGSNWRPAV